MRIENEQIVLEWPDLDEPATPPRVADRRTGAVFDLAGGGETAPMWRAELRDAMGWCQLPAGDASLPKASVERVAEGIRFRLRWDAVPIPGGGGEVDCTVEGSLPDGSDQVSMQASVSVRSPRYALWEFCFPVWPCVSPQGAARGSWSLFTPTGFGEIRRDPARAEFLKENDFREQFGIEPESWRVYPSNGWSMQYGAILAERSVFYLATHDAAPERKKFYFSADGKRAGLHVRIVHYPPLDGAGTRAYAVPYPVVLSVRPGGWYAASQIYSDWVAGARWSRPRRQRRPSPWFENTAVWWLVRFADDSDVAAKARDMEETQSVFGFPSAIHLYDWHRVPFDTLYPDYLPARPGVREFVDRCHAVGVKVMPYINGRICDPNSRAGKRAEPYSVKDAGRLLPVGRRLPRVEHWPSRQRFYPMCPSTPFWHEVMTDVCAAIFRELDVDGIYLDQVGCVGDPRCLDAGHGHPVGAGDYWVRGYEGMMGKIRAAGASGGRDAAFTTESNAEPYCHLFDGLLMWGDIAPDTVPAFTAVHTAHSVCFGLIFGLDDLCGRVAFAERLARQTLWGNQLGWFPDDVRQAMRKPEHRPMLDMLSDGVWAWARMRPWFLDGKVLDPGLVRYSTMRDDSGYIPGLVRAADGPVHATVWSLAGRPAAVLANLSGSPQDGSLEVALDDVMALSTRAPDRGGGRLTGGKLSFSLAPYAIAVAMADEAADGPRQGE